MNKNNKYEVMSYLMHGQSYNINYVSLDRIIAKVVSALHNSTRIKRNYDNYILTHNNDKIQQGIENTKDQLILIEKKADTQKLNNTENILRMDLENQIVKLQDELNTNSQVQTILNNINAEENSLNSSLNDYKEIHPTFISLYNSLSTTAHLLVGYINFGKIDVDIARKYIHKKDIATIKKIDVTINENNQSYTMLMTYEEFDSFVHVNSLSVSLTGSISKKISDATLSTFENSRLLLADTHNRLIEIINTILTSVQMIKTYDIQLEELCTPIV